MFLPLSLGIIRFSAPPLVCSAPGAESNSAGGAKFNSAGGAEFNSAGGAENKTEGQTFFSRFCPPLN
jgi:hypothetical protein